MIKPNNYEPSSDMISENNTNFYDSLMADKVSDEPQIDRRQRLNSGKIIFKNEDSY